MTAPSEQLDLPPWQAGIDPRLIARLARVQRPGLIGLRLARRILGAVDALAGRLPLLARFPRAAASARDAATVLIVHVVPAGSSARRGDPAPVMTAALHGRAAGTVLVAPGRIVERRTERTIVERRTERTIVERIAADDRRAPGAGMHGGSPVAAAPSALAPRTPPTGTQQAAVDRALAVAAPAGAAAAASAPLVHTQDSAGAARSDRTPVAAASPAGELRAAEQRLAPLVSAPSMDPAAPPPIVHALTASAASAVPGDARSASTSRAGEAPRDAVLPIVPERAGGPRPEPAMVERVVGAATGGGDRPPAVVTTPVTASARGRRSRMGAPLVQRQAPQVAPRTAPVESTLADHPGSTRPDLGRSRPMPRGVIVRARGGAPVTPSPSLIDVERALPSVAPRGARSVDAPRAVTVVPRHNAAPAAGQVAPVVVLPQAAPAARGTAGPPLAHLAPASPAPAADRRDAAAPAAPRVEPTASPSHRPITARGPAGPTPPPLDLRQIAAGVQQIFARQAEHERARRGIRR